MIAKIQPSQLGGAVQAPPSKSMAHRALLAAGLAHGSSNIEHVEMSQDILATLRVIQALGAKVAPRKNSVLVTGCGAFATVTMPLDCGESGTTLRLSIPVCSLTGQTIQFAGQGRLFSRPQGVYREIFAQHGLTFAQTRDGLTIAGRLPAGNYTVPGNVSSQFISGLLFALPLMDKGGSITIVPPFASHSYVEMTCQTLRTFGVQAGWIGENRLYVPGNQAYLPRNYTVEGDYSNAAFLLALGAVGGGITVTGLAPDSLQGDRIILNILQRCGAQIEQSAQSIHLQPGVLTGVEVDLGNCPDLGPLLMALGAVCNGSMVLRNAGRLRLKESDRIAAMQEELQKFGVMVQPEGETVHVYGTGNVATKDPLPRLNGHNDHRVVMSLAVAALAQGRAAEIAGAEAVAKSWPDFFGTLRALGAQVELVDETD